MSRHLLRDRARRYGQKWLTPHSQLPDDQLRFRMENSWIAGYDAAVRDLRAKQRGSRGNKLTEAEE